MKKAIVCLLLVVMCFSLSACSTSKTPDKQTTTTTSTTKAQTTTLTTTTKPTTTAKPTTTTTAIKRTTTAKETTTTMSYDKLTELREINNYSSAKDYLTNASDKDRIRLIAKELWIDDLKGVLKNFTPSVYYRGDDEKAPQPDNEYGYYARIQLSEDVYKTLAKEFSVEQPPRLNVQWIKDEASWWDVSSNDVKYLRQEPRSAWLSDESWILTVWANGYLVDNNTEYYLYIRVDYSCVSDYYIRENKN